MDDEMMAPVMGLPYRILVTGWRFWPREAAYVVHKTLRYVAGLSLAYAQPVVVREGQCPYGGVDDYAYEWATLHAAGGVEPDRMPANWTQFGKAAGPLRNQDMVNKGLDICLGFPGPPVRKYSGTVDCMNKAHKAGHLVVSVPWVDWFLTEPTRFNAASYVDTARAVQGHLF